MTANAKFRTKQSKRNGESRRGATATLIAVLMIPILGIVSFGIDYGYLLAVRSDMQRAADAAALAGAQDLIHSLYASKNIKTARATVRKYVQANLGDSFSVLDSDIEIGKYDTETIYKKVSLMNQQPYDAIRVTLRRDGLSNPSVGLRFAAALGIRDADVVVKATAILRKADRLAAGADVLPFAVFYKEWESIGKNSLFILYGDGKIENESGIKVSGNWGTVDIGLSNNSTDNLGDQIINGLRQHDLDALYKENRIQSSKEISAGERIWLNADTGLSSGLKASVREIHGQVRLIPIYDMINATPDGNNLEFRVVHWGTVKVLYSHWKGSKSTFIIVEKDDAYVGSLKPQTDLGASSDSIEGAFTAPALAE